MTPARTPLLPRPPQLTQRRRTLVYAILVGIWASGTCWLLLQHFFQVQGPFGPRPHPLEFWTRAAHGAFGFASLWLFGALWVAHVGEGWRSLRRRRSGVTMFAFFAWLAVSGYLLYYLGDEAAIGATALLHWAAGLALPVPFLLHRFAGLGAKAKTRRV